MIRCCLSCKAIAGYCKPDTTSPADPAYASDCPYYDPIPREFKEKLIEAGHVNIARYLFSDEEVVEE